MSCWHTMFVVCSWQKGTKEWKWSGEGTVGRWIPRLSASVSITDLVLPLTCMRLLWLNSPNSHEHLLCEFGKISLLVKVPLCFLLSMTLPSTCPSSSLPTGFHCLFPLTVLGHMQITLFSYNSREIVVLADPLNRPCVYKPLSYRLKLGLIQ